MTQSSHYESIDICICAHDILDLPFICYRCCPFFPIHSSSIFRLQYEIKTKATMKMERKKMYNKQTGERERDWERKGTRSGSRKPGSLYATEYHQANDIQPCSSKELTDEHDPKNKKKWMPFIQRKNCPFVLKMMHETHKQIVLQNRSIKIAFFFLSVRIIEHNKLTIFHSLCAFILYFRLKQHIQFAKKHSSRWCSCLWMAQTRKSPLTHQNIWYFSFHSTTTSTTMDKLYVSKWNSYS